jgi:hypothetical protein
MLLRHQHLRSEMLVNNSNGRPMIRRHYWGLQDKDDTYVGISSCRDYESQACREHHYIDCIRQGSR